METEETTLEGRLQSNRLQKLSSVDDNDTANYVLYTDAGCISKQQGEEPLVDETGAILLGAGYTDIKQYGDTHIMQRRGPNGIELIHYKPIESDDKHAEYLADMITKIVLLPKDGNRRHSLGEIVRAFLEKGRTIVVDARHSGQGELLRKYFIRDGEIDFDKIEIGYKPPY